jgi:threonine aldolase
MPPKMRFLGAQMSAYLKDDLWLQLARQANASAIHLADVLTTAGATLAHPTDGNEVFAILPPGLGERLKAAGVGFYPWIDGSHRFVCSWATQPVEILDFSRLLGVR